MLATHICCPVSNGTGIQWQNDIGCTQWCCSIMSLVILRVWWGVMLVNAVRYPVNRDKGNGIGNTYTTVHTEQCCHCCKRLGIAQLGERLTEKAGAIQTQGWVPGVAGIFSQSTSSATLLVLWCLYSSHVQSHFACINSCVHIKNPKRWQLYYSLDTRKYFTHW